MALEPTPNSDRGPASESVLVTGVNGFIGKRIATALLDAGYRVVGIGIEERSVVVHANLRYRQVDITAVDALVRVFTDEDCTAVVHLAALVHASPGRHSWSEYARVNYRASERVFRLAAEHGVKRIAFFSTVEVYGPVAAGSRLTEGTPCRPESDYAKSKLLAEEALAAEAARSGLEHAILRCAPVYADEFRLNVDKRLYLIPPAFAYYFGRGEYQLSLCAVNNITHFVVRWLKAAVPCTGIFNLADSCTYAVRDLLAFERRHGRARLAIRLPYLPCLLLIAAAEVGMRVSGRSPGMLTVSNFRKLMRSSVWDNSRARSAVGDLPWTIETSLYDNSWPK